MSLTDQIKSIPLKDVIESAGLKISSGGFVRCPFHDDRDPSFYVKNNRFKCFGCGVGGDAVDFVQMLHLCDFDEACRYLGIKRGPINKAQIIKFKKKRPERERYRQRESDLAYTLALLTRTARKIIDSVQTIEDLEENAGLLQALPFWEHCHYALSQGEPEDRREVVNALTDRVGVERNYLFNPEFDYRGWLRDFLNGVPGEQQERIKISFS